MLTMQIVDQLTGIIVEERWELEEENRVLQSLALLAHMKVRKANQEVEELTLKCNNLIEDLDVLMEHNRLLWEKCRELKGKKTVVKWELAEVKEELSQIALECKRLQDERADA